MQVNCGRLAPFLANVPGLGGAGGLGNESEHLREKEPIFMWC